MFKRFFKKTPFFFLTFWLIFGIIVREFYVSELLTSYLALFVPIAIWVCFQCISRYSKSIAQNSVSLILLSFIFLIFGYHVSNRHYVNYNIGEKILQEKNKFLAIRITSIPDTSSGTLKADGILLGSISKNKLVNYHRRFKLKIYQNLSNNNGKTLQANDIIVLSKPINPIQKNSIPNSFNYKTYCFRKNIMGTIYLNDYEYQTISKSIIKLSFIDNFNSVTLNLKSFLFSVLEKNLIDANEVVSVAKAITLGYKSSLDKELLNSYSKSGVIHIIAISGLHIYLLYGIFCSLLFFLRSSKNTLLKTIIALGLIWFYTLLIDSPVSAIRASVIITFVYLSPFFTKQKTHYNALFVAAFFILFFSPMQLFQLGFQLSFLAILSIMFFKPILDKYFRTRYKLVEYFRQIIITSIAVQILVLPIIIYHFENIPNYFLAYNIIFLPVIGVVLYGFVLIFISGTLGITIPYLGQLLSWIILQLNRLTQLTNVLPYSTSHFIHFQFLDIVLIYSTLLGLVLAYYTKIIKLFYLAIVLFVAIILLRVNTLVKDSKRYEMDVFRFDKKIYLQFTKGSTSYLMGDIRSLKDFHKSLLSSYNSYNNKNIVKEIALLDNQAVRIGDLHLSVFPDSISIKTGNKVSGFSKLKFYDSSNYKKIMFNR